MWTPVKFAKAALRVVAPCLMITVAGCADYLARSDTMTPWSGDALAGNAALQMIDPWPPYAGDKDIRFDGTRMGNAVANYHAGPAAPSAMADTYDTGAPTQTGAGGTQTQ